MALRPRKRRPTPPISVDDWRAETLSRLHQSRLYTLLEQKCKSDAAGTGVLALVGDATTYAFQRTKMIIRHMGEFTLHDGDHLFRVLNLMERLIPMDTRQRLSVPELLLLILAAFFHDIGMAPSEDDVRAWLSIWDENGPTREQLGMASAFERFIKGRADTQAELDSLRTAGRHAQADIITRYLVSEYIRITHASRARHIIATDWSDKIVYRDVPLARHLADICYSHIDDARKLLNLDTSLVCGPTVFACLPFIGVFLRLADILDFDGKRTPSVLFAHLGVRHPVSLREWQKHRAVSAWTITPETIVFAAECDHPAIEAAIRGFCDLIDRELVASTFVLTNLRDNVRDPWPPHYRVQLPQAVDRSKIGPKRDVEGSPAYTYRETRFSLVQSQVTDLLMGTKLYTDPQAALRELLQNSIDACLVRAALEKTWGNSYVPDVAVEFGREEDRDLLRVSDNGIGMDEEIIDKYYSRVGASYYKSNEFLEMQAATGIRVNVTARFGIGVLSYFMVADSVSVESRRLVGPHDSRPPIEVLVEGLQSLFWVRRGARDRPGTVTTLWLKKGHPWERKTDKERIELVESTIPNPPWQLDLVSRTSRARHTALKFRAPNRKWASNFRYGAVHMLNLNDEELSLTGNAAVPVIEKSRMPVASKSLFSRRVSVVGYSPVKLSRQIRLGVNEIEGRSTGLEIRGRRLETEVHFDSVLRSGSEVAVCGVAVPMNLVPQTWEDRAQRARLYLPGAMYLRVDIGYTQAIDLNSARTQVIANEKWLALCERLGLLIGSAIREKVGTRYWQRLKLVWGGVDDVTAEFMAGVARVR
jgi:molecular chaperone HtpG